MFVKINKFDSSYIISSIGFFISIFPICFLIGSLIINLNSLIIVLLFFIYSIKEKSFFFVKNNFFILLILFWLSLIINLYFSSNFDNSLSRTLGFVRFVIIVIAIKLFFENSNEKQKRFVLLTWVFIFTIVSVDLVYEFIFGFNTLGFKSYMPGRLAGFLNEELKIGQFFSAFFLICAVTIFNSTKKVYYLYFFIFFSILVSLLIGERSNFIRVFMMSVCFLFFFNNHGYLKKLSLIFLISLLTIIFINFNEQYKKRFYGQFVEPLINGIYIKKGLKSNSVQDLINYSVYGANFDRAIKIFESNRLFGVGIKNFRIESNKPQYKNDDLKFNDQAATTHPHQIHLEMLSETGLFGYTCFLIFIICTIFIAYKNYKKTGNLYILSAILYFVFSLAPLIPSGSFFTTYGATLFWLNYSFITLEKKSNQK